MNSAFGPAGRDELTPDEQVNIAVYENVNRGVVNINTKGDREAFFILDIPTEGMGSGSVLDKSGHILTNYHVIEGAKEIEVALFNGKSFPGKVLAHDAVTDLAVLRIEAPPEMLFPIRIGDSTQLKVGQRAFAIGNPFGLERTLTTGVISSLNRSLPSRTRTRLRSLIQIDAAINPGNSGGPLLDSHSRLIGMNVAIASRTGQSTGVGFAIPASTITRLVPQLIEKGRVIRPDAGIVRVYETERGLLVAGLAPKGPAEQAGLRGPQIRVEKRRQGPFVYESQQVDRTAADLIIGVDAERITTADQFLAAIESKAPGDEVTLIIVRSSQEMSLRIRLVESAP
ncbi:MAG TPA: trypsin-like peptidase domain-containing protein [Pirellulales bacterium]